MGGESVKGSKQVDYSDNIESNVHGWGQSDDNGSGEMKQGLKDVLKVELKGTCSVHLFLQIIIIFTIEIAHSY